MPEITMFLNSSLYLHLFSHILGTFLRYFNTNHLFHLTRIFSPERHNNEILFDLRVFRNVNILQRANSLYEKKKIKFNCQKDFFYELLSREQNALLSNFFHTYTIESLI